MPSAAHTSLTGNRNFKRLWLGQAVSTTGDAFAFVAMPLLVLEATGSVVQMGAVTACACAGQVIASFFSGVAVDRLHRRFLMIACDVARLLLYAMIPALWWAGHPSVAAIYVVAGLGAAFGGVFMIGYFAAIPNVVDRADVPAANGRLQATQSLTYILGSILAGIITQEASAASALVVDAVSFGASAACLATIRLRQERAARDPAAPRAGAFTELAVGIRFLFGHRVLRALAVFQVGVALLASIGLTAAVIDLIVFRLRSDLAQGGRVVGVSLAVSAIGAVIGALAGGRIGRRVGLGVCTLAGTGLQALGLLLAGSMPTVLAVTAGAGMWAAGLTTRSVAATSLRQTSIPDGLLGRVTSASMSIVMGASMVGAVFVTRLAAQLGTARALTSAGFFLALITTAGVFTPLASTATPSRS